MPPEKLNSFKLDCLCHSDIYPPTGYAINLPAELNNYQLYVPKKFYWTVWGNIQSDSIGHVVSSAPYPDPCMSPIGASAVQDFIFASANPQFSSSGVNGTAAIYSGTTILSRVALVNRASATGCRPRTVNLDLYDPTGQIHFPVPFNRLKIKGAINYDPSGRTVEPY